MTETALNVLSNQQAKQTEQSEQTQQNRQIKKRRKIMWNWNRAEQNVEADYMGASPLFDDRQFVRCFRITRAMADKILTECASQNGFFRSSINATGSATIVKLLVALKILAYGVSPSAFQDYFQMGISTMLNAVKQLTIVLTSNNALKDEYLCDMT